MNSFVTRVRNRIEGSNTYGNSKQFWVAFIIGFVGLLIYPLLFGTFAASNAALFFIFSFLGLSLAFIWGYCGILSFGQVIFFGIGGYTFGIVGINFPGAGWSLIGLLLAVVVAAAGAAILGYFMFYGGIRDVYVSIITLVVTLVAFTSMSRSSRWEIGEASLGGLNGMTGIPTLQLGIGETAIAVDGVVIYYFVLGTLLVTYIGLRALVNSQYGHSMVAVREDESRTQSFGYNTARIKLVVFSIGGALGGFGGALFASWGNYIDPSVFGISFAILPVIWVSIGGRKSLIGAITATIFIEWLSNRLAVTGSEYALIVVGVLLLGTILFLPEGVVPRLVELFDSLKRPPDRPSRREDSSTPE